MNTYATAISEALADLRESRERLQASTDRLHALGLRPDSEPLHAPCGRPIRMRRSPDQTLYEPDWQTVHVCPGESEGEEVVTN